MCLCVNQPQSFKRITKSHNVQWCTCTCTCIGWTLNVVNCKNAIKNENRITNLYYAGNTTQTYTCMYMYIIINLLLLVMLILCYLMIVYEIKYFCYEISMFCFSNNLTSEEKNLILKFNYLLHCYG